MVCDSLPTKVNQSVSQGVQNEEPYQPSVGNLLVSQHRGLREAPRHHYGGGVTQFLGILSL